MKIGTEVLVTHELERERSEPNREDKTHQVRWIAVPVEKPYKAYYIGYRHLQNGIYHAGSYRYSGGYGGMGTEDYDPPYIKVSETVKAALVVKNERQNPIRVPLDKIKADA